MSRIGKKPIEIPANVKIDIQGENLKVLGVKGELQLKLMREVNVEVKDNKVFVTGKTGSIWGLHRALIANMVEGVSKGFEKKLEIEGVGFKANVEGNNLVLNVGFINPVKIARPEGVEFKVEKNVITVSGIDKQKVGEVASVIRRAKKAEPYKGKGIKYQGERIRRKEGKKVVASKK